MHCILCLLHQLYFVRFSLGSIDAFNSDDNSTNKRSRKRPKSCKCSTSCSINIFPVDPSGLQLTATSLVVLHLIFILGHMQVCRQPRRAACHLHQRRSSLVVTKWSHFRECQCTIFQGAKVL